MSLIIGRAGSDATNGVLRFSKIRADGDDLDISGWVHDTTSAAEMRAVRDQLRGLLKNPDVSVQPTTSSEDPTLDAFYRILGGTVETTPTMRSGARALPFDLSLRRVRSSHSPMFESMLRHGTRTGSTVTAANADPLVGIPPDSTSYRRGSVGLSSLVGRNVAGFTGASVGSVLVDVWAGNAAHADAEWQAPPGTFLEGACTISQSIGSGAYRACVGRQLTAAATGWVLANGLVSVLPAQVGGGAAGSLRVLSWAGTAYESTTDIPITVGTPWNSFSGVTILRNSPEACTLRIVGSVSGSNVGTLDLTIRRGDRNLLGVLRSPVNVTMEIDLGSSATSITGALRQTSNDGSGNRWVLSSALGTLSAVDASAEVSSAQILDFGFGIEIDGSGSSGIDTAQSLANQYAGYVSELVRVTNP